MRRRLGKAEIGLISIAAMLTGIEVVAILAGMGPQFAIVTLGYFLGAGAGYAVYRRARTETAMEREASTLLPVPMKRDDEWDGLKVARNCDLLRALTNEQVDRVLDIALIEPVAPGTPLAAAGSTGEWLYIIVDGAVELTGSSNVGEVTVRIAHGGEAFPLAALLGGGELVTSAVAMTDVMILAVPRDKLIALCEQRPDIGTLLYRTMAELLAERYRATLRRHLDGVSDAVRQPERWANV